ncbi:MAG: ComF family protein [Bacillota bacterium]
MEFLETVLDLIYPRKERCLNCGRAADFLEVKGLCGSCLGKIEFVESFCRVCGREVREKTDICSDCREGERYFDMARAAVVYTGPARYLLIKFKYYGRRNLSSALAEIMKIYFSEYFFNIDIDYIVPVPLSPVRYRQRGFNQASLLARRLACGTRQTFLGNSLVRKRESVPLFNLNESERRAAVRGVFSLRESGMLPKDSRVLLVDDIFTTGSTVDEASRILKLQGGAKKVFVLTLATASMTRFQKD